MDTRLSSSCYLRKSIRTPKLLRSDALTHAAANGLEAIVKLLLEKEADLDAKNNCCRTPQSYAVENGREAVVKLLLDTGKFDAPRKTTTVGHCCHGLHGIGTRRW